MKNLPRTFDRGGAVDITTCTSPSVEDVKVEVEVEVEDAFNN